MNFGFALTLTLSLGRGNKRSLAPFSLGRRVGDEGQPYLHSETPEILHRKTHKKKGLLSFLQILIRIFFIPN
jgi:hypothetical protein